MHEGNAEIKINLILRAIRRSCTIYLRLNDAGGCVGGVRGDGGRRGAGEGRLRRKKGNTYKIVWFRQFVFQVIVLFYVINTNKIYFNQNCLPSLLKKRVYKKKKE